MIRALARRAAMVAVFTIVAYKFPVAAAVFGLCLIIAVLS